MILPGLGGRIGGGSSSSSSMAGGSDVGGAGGITSGTPNNVSSVYKKRANQTVNEKFYSSKNIHNGNNYYFELQVLNIRV